MTEEKLECLIYLLLAEVASLGSGCITPAGTLTVKDFENLDRVSAAFVEEAIDGNWIDLYFRGRECFRLRIERIGGTEN